MKKILFINPPGISLGFNVGLCYLAAVLKRNGFEVKIIDFLNQPGNEDKRLLQAGDYDVVGISIKTLVIDDAIRIIRKVKKINNKATIICGGVHISLDGYNFMKENEIFDIAFMTNSEESIVDYMKGRKIGSISGVIYRDGKKLIANQKKEPGLTLDELPYPDFDSFDIPLKIIKNYPLVTSRGCPYNCTYCPVQVVGKKWTSRSVRSLISELKKVKPRIREFHIVDDNFTLNMQRAKEFCKSLVEEKFNIRWSCPNGIRADKIDVELARLMKKSGCYLVNIGIESAVESVFNKINKGESLNDIKKAVSMLKKEGIAVFGNFIIGLLGSTFKIDMLSLKKSKELGLAVSFWGPLSVYPGTKVYETAIHDKKTKFLRDWKKGFAYNFKDKPTLAFEREDYKENEMIKMFFISNLRSKAYGALIDPKKRLMARVINLLGIILEYDPIHVFNHIFNAFVIFIRYRKTY